MGLEKLMKSNAFKQGISFGVVSSAMTVLGMSFGMWSSQGTIRNIIASIIGLSISNSLADGFSMYMANVARGDSKMQALQSASVTAVVEGLLPFFFLLPFFYMKTKSAIILNALVGVSLVAITGLYVSRLTKDDEKETIDNSLLYILVTLGIMACTYFGGILATKVA